MPAGYGPPDVMGLIVTWNRAAIYCCTKKIGIAGIASSHEVEGIATPGFRRASGFRFASVPTPQARTLECWLTQTPHLRPPRANK